MPIDERPAAEARCYCVCLGHLDELRHFEQMVSRSMDQGWHPLGGVAIAADGQLLQALVRGTQLVPVAMHGA